MEESMRVISGVLWLYSQSTNVDTDVLICKIPDMGILMNIDYALILKI